MFWLLSFRMSAWHRKYTSQTPWQTAPTRCSDGLYAVENSLLLLKFRGTLYFACKGGITFVLSHSQSEISKQKFQHWSNFWMSHTWSIPSILMYRHDLSLGSCKSSRAALSEANMSRLAHPRSAKTPATWSALACITFFLSSVVRAFFLHSERRAPQSRLIDRSFSYHVWPCTDGSIWENISIILNGYS